MKVNVKPLQGPWTSGYALDKHTVSSRYLGDDDNGRPQFETDRTEVGEAVFKLKYRSDWSQIDPLADAALQHGIPNARQITAVVAMPASTVRARQPVTELAAAIAQRLNVPVLDVLSKAATAQLKNLSTRDEKDAVLSDAFRVGDVPGGPHHVLLVDDLFHTGASMVAGCRALLTSPAIDKVSIAAMTWR
ncbi:ComF family protein [Roseomonas aeriglobus]|nr:ComF family protein [Roseomonas aeriglobus]